MLVSLLPLFSVYGGLFAVAFFAATILPLQSEALLVALLLGEKYSPVLLLLTASTGNLAGAMVNWWLGRRIDQFRQKSWFPIEDQRLLRAQTWYRRYGRWSLLFSWAPIIGDPLTVVAGVLGEPLLNFVLLVGVAKFLRYFILTMSTVHWLI